MNIKDILNVIEGERGGYYNPPISYYTQTNIEFEYNSYKKSALDEIKIYLINHKKEHPVKTIEDFRNMMDDFACQATTGSANFMFSVYYDAATDILDILLSMG